MTTLKAELLLGKSVKYSDIDKYTLFVIAKHFDDFMAGNHTEITVYRKISNEVCYFFCYIRDDNSCRVLFSNAFYEKNITDFKGNVSVYVYKVAVTRIELEILDNGCHNHE